MSTANFGVLYTQTAGVLPTGLAYVDRAQTFEDEQTFTEQVILNSGAVAFNDPFFCAIDVSALGGSAIPNKAYVDTIAGVNPASVDGYTWAGEQNFNAGVTIVGDTGIEGEVSVDGVSTFSGGLMTINAGLLCSNVATNTIRGGDGQLGISAQYEQYLVNNVTSGYAVQPDYGTPNIIYTRSGSAIGINVGINLPSPTACLGKRITFVAVKDPFQITGVIKNFDNVAYSNIVVAECATVTLCALNVNNDCWYVLSHNGTITYNV